MNLCWVPHAGLENHCETRKSSKICYFFNINQERVYRSLSRTSTNWKDASRRSESHGYWMCCRRVAQHLYMLAFVLEADILSTYC